MSGAAYEWMDCLFLKSPDVSTFTQAAGSVLAMNDIAEHTGPEPPFVARFRKELLHKRSLQTEEFMYLNQNFPDAALFFETRGETRDPGEWHVSLAELNHYNLVAVCDMLADEKSYWESQQNHLHSLLYPLKGFVRSLGGELTFEPNCDLIFVAENQKELGERRYRTKNDLDIRFQRLPHILIKVSSDPKGENDRWHMLLQASWLAGLSRYINDGEEPDPFVVSAIYIDARMTVSWYHVFQDQDGKVKYIVDNFPISSMTGVLRFLVWLYNATELASKMLRDVPLVIQQVHGSIKAVPHC